MKPKKKRKKKSKRSKGDQFIVMIAIADDKEENIYTLQDGKPIRKECWRKVRVNEKER